VDVEQLADSREGGRSTVMGQMFWKSGQTPQILLISNQYHADLPAKEASKQGVNSRQRKCQECLNNVDDGKQTAKVFHQDAS